MSSAEPSLNRATSPEPEQDGADVGRKRTKEEAMIEIETVTDEEVEEFCAILRRLRRPVKYFGGIGRVKRWRPSFVAEDFNGVDGGGGGGGGKVKENEKGDDGGNGLVDLNVDPLTE